MYFPYPQDVITSAGHLNSIQFVLMVVEGIVASCLATLFITYITLKLTNQRYNLYSVFMVVPVSLLKSLATKSSLLDETDTAAGRQEAAVIKDTAQGKETPHQTVRTVYVC